MMEKMLTVVYAFFGVAGFALFLSAKKKRIIPASLNGMCAWAVYLIADRYLGDVFAASLIAAIFATVTSELMSHFLGVSGTVFYILGLIPLIPGSSLYYLMEAYVNADSGAILSRGNELIKTLVGIGAGYAAVSCARGIVREIRLRKEREK